MLVIIEALLQRYYRKTLLVVSVSLGSENVYYVYCTVDCPQLHSFIKRSQNVTRAH